MERGLLKVICFQQTLESDQMEMISESHIETNESAYIFKVDESLNVESDIKTDYWKWLLKVINWIECWKW